MKKMVLVFVVLMPIVLLAASVDDEERHIYYAVVPGRYALIGQFPDAGSVYNGTAQISARDGRFHLTKHVDGKDVTAEGQVERANPGETDVVRFRWSGHTETCLVSADLDNYSRLTCYWEISGAGHRKPGLEAYFPIDTGR